jgi:formylglycine-generating enzyme required for sulfatase activity
MRAATFLLVVLAAAGCGTSSGDQTGGVATAVGLAHARYAIVDLASGRLETRLELSASELADPAYRTSRLLLRRIDGGSTQIGSNPGGFAVQSDELPSRTAAGSVLFIGVCEATQAQWTALGGGTPWLAAGVRSPGGDAVGPRLPAYGISRDAAQATLAGYASGRGYSLVLPSDEQWERACRAGTTSTYWWGEGVDPATDIAPRALVSETAGSVRGPREADGSRAANAFGLYDLHGNLWEWVSGGSGTIRGGSWNDNLTMARSANRVALDRSTAHPLVGVRVVLVP